MDYKGGQAIVSAMTARITEYGTLYTKAFNEGGDSLLTELKRSLCLTDLFYLLVEAFGRKDVVNEWLFKQCVEVQKEPDNHLDLWAREHYKSTIITYAKTIQDILSNPEITVGIFSHTKPIAKAFLFQIKYELENNELLKKLFPEVLWNEPKTEAPRAGVQWSSDKGITVRRKTNPKEATIEANGLVDGQPTSKHYSLLVYDDVVTIESVSSPEMMKKTTDALALSYNLGAHGGKRRFIGTRYHFNDTYASLLERKTAVPRIRPGTESGKHDGVPVFLPREDLDKKRREMGTYVYSCQILQDPNADSAQGFEETWLNYYSREPQPNDMNVYILVDPANAKRKMNDFTSMWVIGLCSDQCYYWLDGLRDRLNLTERTNALFELHQKWKPDAVGYEHYGIQADIQHIEYVQDEKNYRFKITPLGGQMPKNDRIRRLVPIFENNRFIMPQQMQRFNSEGRSYDLVQTFIKEEYKAFPVMAHDDMLDCAARILDPDLKTMFPSTGFQLNLKPKSKRAFR